MKTLLFLFLGLILSYQCFPQEETLKGQWKNKSARKDSIFLTRGGLDHQETLDYLKQKKEFKDTSYYWNFYDKDSLSIERVIRSMKIVDSTFSDGTVLIGEDDYYNGKIKNSKKLKGHKKEKKAVEKTINKSDQKNKAVSEKEKDSSISLTEFELNDTISVKEARLSLWDTESGKWILKNNLLEITNTKSFNGFYELRMDSKNQIRLLKK